MFYKEYIASGLVAQGEGDDKGAEAFFNEALAEAERVDPNGPRVVEVLSHIAIFYGQIGREAEAAPLMERAASIYNARMADSDGGWTDKIKNLKGRFKNA